MGALRLATFLIAALMAVVAAGCGSSDAAAPQVPGPPAEVTIPESSQAPTAAAGSNSDSKSSTDSSSSSSDSSSSDSSSSTDTGTGSSDTGTGTTGDSSGGTTSPSTGTADSTATPPAGSNAQQFEDFCAQNPGAC